MKKILFSTAIVASLVLNTSAQVMDSFDQGNLDDWTVFSPLEVVGAPASINFVEANGGKAIQVLSPAPSLDLAGPARGFLYHNQKVSGLAPNFTAAVDILDWDNTLDQAFGFFFRAPEESIGLGTTAAYVVNYDPNQASGARGELHINRVAGEAAVGTIVGTGLSLEPGEQYRMVLRAEGQTYSVWIYDLRNLTSPVVTFTQSDDFHPLTSNEEVVGLFNFSRESDVTDPNLSFADSTFDNFTLLHTAEPEIPLPATTSGVSQAPQVYDLAPLNRATFHPASEGINFKVKTSDPNASISLSLNNVSVSNQIDHRYEAGSIIGTVRELTPQQHYQATLSVVDGAGMTTTTSWQFDTFTEDHLTGPTAVVIEAEDYNFGGEFIDNPTPSGFDSNGDPVNEGVGYLDRPGLLWVDYFDRADITGGGDVPEYRVNDFTGTQQGNVEFWSENDMAHPQVIVNDVIRAKYSSLGLPEYQVHRTEGGEWMNYTRTFPENTYHAFLRVGAKASQEVLLDEIISGQASENQTLASLGSFKVKNSGLRSNYQFVPLTDSEGNRVALPMSGEKTVRLTMGGDPIDNTKNTLTLNYLLFTPALEPQDSPGITITSASTVNGPYTEDETTILSDNTITSSLGDDAKFIRIEGPVSVKSISVQGSQLVVELLPQ